ncbi:uncharacterized protein BJ212DRAFT_1478003 [Suillus subaureus]|uniref:Uncharacterized protein n=1 Tax=Suillus subaureus TaxID=48587 RepID=A0A9P7EGT4_9AGAM|nr:uncharacterized protein BJ212DRAFT_1478003 [Suillus subaureus]KAG1820909.1 hypothetical protein BJ212DRAFT_1478003 [Suillus subaureus]
MITCRQHYSLGFTVRTVIHSLDSQILTTPPRQHPVNTPQTLSSAAEAPPTAPTLTAAPCVAVTATLQNPHRNQWPATRLQGSTAHRAGPSHAADNGKLIDVDVIDDVNEEEDGDLLTPVEVLRLPLFIFLIFLLAEPMYTLDIQKEDPSYNIAEYSSSTTTGTLHRYLLKIHLHVYITAIEQHNLKVEAKEVWDLLDRGWTLTQIGQELDQYLDKLLESFCPPPSGGGLASQPRVGVLALADEMPDFTIEEMHRQLIKFIVVNNQVMNKDLWECDIPHQMKLHKLIVETWYQYFDVLKQDLAKAEGKILFTSDLWSDENHHLFIALIAHWIAQHGSKLILEAGLLAFSHIPGSYDGVSLAVVILGLLDCAEVTDKSFHFG